MVFGPQVESLVSLGWCIRREGNEDADYLPPYNVALNIANTLQSEWPQALGYPSMKTTRSYGY